MGTEHSRTCTNSGIYSAVVGAIHTANKLEIGARIFLRKSALLWNFGPFQNFGS